MSESRNPAVGARRTARRRRASTKSEQVTPVADGDAAADAAGDDRPGGEPPTQGAAAGSGGETGTGESASEGAAGGSGGETGTGESAGETGTGGSAGETGAGEPTSSEVAGTDSGKARKRSSSSRARTDGGTGPRRSGRARQPAKGQAKPKARTGKPKSGKGKPKGRRPRSDARRRGTWSGELELSDGGLAVADADGNLIQYAPAKVAKSLRYLLARLERDPGVGLPKRVAFTSVLSGEGVSVVARSFAAVLAHDTGRTVCVVDLNWWSNDESAPGGQAEPHGLYEVLWMEKSLDAVLARTQTPELFYLHAGSPPASVRPMLAHHPRLGATLDELASRFDHLVVDLPAVGARSEAIGLSQFCDWVVLVIQQGVPSRKQLQSALSDLGDTRPVAAVLNRSESKIPSFVRRLLGL